MKRKVLWLGLGILAGCVLAWWLTRPGPDGDNTDNTDKSPTVTAQFLTRAIEVVAVAENGKDYRAAIAGWTELLAARPNDRDLLRNQAVTVLKWINDTNAVLASGSIKDQADIAQLEKQLADANVEADRVLQKLTNSRVGPGEQDTTQALLESELLVTRSRVVSLEEGVELRKRAAETLIAALDKKADQPLLAATLVNLSEELQLDWPEVVPRATEAAYQAWQAQPRNLWLMIRAGQRLADAKDKRLLQVIEASIELAKPLTSMIKASDLKIAQPEGVLAATRAAVETGDWSKPPRVRPWFNILSGTSAFVADGRLLNPDIMALLDTSFLERWREGLKSDSGMGTAKLIGIELQKQELPDAIPLSEVESPLLTAWYDFDVDRDFDVLAIHGTQLNITRRDDANPGKLSCELPFEANGFLIADLWSVDSPQRPTNKPSTDSPTNRAGISHDTIQELLLWNTNQFVVVSPDPAADQLNVLADIAGLSHMSAIERAIVAELDGDGDLDIVVVTASGLKFLQNNGNRTFTDVTEYTALPPADWIPSGLVACDYDRDLDLDIICTSTASPYLAVMENILHSQFRYRPLNESHWQSRSPLHALSVLELDGNASWDLALLGDKSLEAVLTRTVGPGQCTAALRQSSNLNGSRGQAERMKLADLNVDGHVDVCLAGPRGIRVYWNDGQRLSADAEMILDSPTSGLDIQDADGDGRLDLLTSIKGVVQHLKAIPSSDVHYLGARIRGLNDINGGGRINHFGIGSTLELWAENRYQARVVDSPLTHFGLPGSQADDLRVIFNNGLTQNVVRPTADSLVQERQELKGSCPFVYGWNGERFEMITDLLWNAPLGLQLSRGQALPDRRWENLLLPGKLVQPRDGVIELRVTEELWEVAYFDHLQLTAIDHPSSVEVWTNEKVGPPALAEPRLFTASRPIYPIAARDGYGRDCLERLKSRDRQYVQAFKRQICQGLCEPHSLELTFDPDQLGLRHDVRLVLTGWMHPTDTSLNIGISQNSDRQLPTPPSLWAPNANGQFICKQPFMGFPGGKPKTIVVELKDVFEGNDTRLRIDSSQQIYWDQAYLTVDEPPVPIVSQDMNCQSAELHYRGFGRLLPRENDQPHWYDYHEVNPSAKWPPLEGLFTRYGDVLPQLVADDDHMVVMASGDEMILKFEIPQRPLQEGWTRDYVLHSVGWDKDADLNTLEGQSSLPLPFASMHSYPPSLEDESRAQAVQKLNEDTLVPRDMYRKFQSRPQ